MKDRKIDLLLVDSTDGVEFSYQQHFDYYRALLEFMRTEYRYWLDKYNYVNETRTEPVSDNHLKIYETFNTLISILEGWIKEIESWDDALLAQNIAQLQSSYILNLKQNWLWSGHEFIHTYLECFKNYGHRAAAGFLEFILQKSVQHTQRHESFMGYLIGYEFKVQGSEVTKRKNAAKVSLGQIRTQFETSKNKLFSEVDTLKTDFTDWDQGQRSLNERLFKIQKYLGERKVRSQNNKFMNHLDGWQSRILDLEHTYGEKLKLEKPAIYWKRAAKKYGIQGGLYTLAIVVLVVVGLIYFRDFFLMWLQGKALDIQLNSIQGVILFGTFATVYGYFLKVLSRLAFSSLHLMRDAEEREQLTYLYLSLSNESVVDEKSRDIVLQSLFSRTQTGLLTNDNGPTMPGLGELANIIGKAK